KLKELKIEIQVIQNKISKLGPIEEVHNFYEININVNVLEKGAFDIELRYTMFEAWWTPFYDAVLIENKARLTVMANVYNRTGLDWKNIELEISTASLKPIKLIKPEPLILKEHIPYAAKADMAPKKKAKMPLSATRATTGFFADGNIADDDSGIVVEKLAAEMEAEPMPDITETYAEVSENIGVQSFKIPDLIDIPSDKNPHPVNLTVQELETEKKYFWSSAISENVIIRDTLINGDLLLLAGNVKIYFKEEFLGETSIPLIAPKEKFKLGTRVSYDLKIDKKLVNRTKIKKPIKGILKNSYEHKITIKNLNKVSEELTIYDKIPHSSSENIKVEIIEINLEPTKKELGVLKWKLNTKGLNEKTIQYKYNVEYKKDIIITPSLP
ncbi:MAG TPA: mucoidy inhibitor MuiA family protein, partial [Candidatus Lokiarchaeia archaeon]